MATIGLGLAGSAFGGPVGLIAGAVGALVGSYIDQAVILPTLFPRPDIIGEKIQELHVQGSDEGYSLSTVYGRQARVTGGIIWHSGWIEEKVEEDVGGKGNDTQKRVTYVNYMSLAIALSRRECASLEKIIIEGKVVYNANPNVSIAGSGLSVTVPTAPTDRMIVNSPVGGPDLGLLQDGEQCTIAGFSNAGNNGTARVKSAITNADGSSVAVFRKVTAVAETGATASFNQTLPTHDPAKVLSVTFYTGSLGQLADPVIESYETSSATPAYRGVTYVVLEKLRLNDYGNRVPQMSFIVVGNASETINTVVSGILLDAGRTINDFDVSRLNGSAVAAYPIAGIQTASGMLSPIILAHDILTQENEGVLQFFHRIDATIIEVPIDHVSAAAVGDSPSARHLQWTRISDKSLPREVNLKFSDPNSDSQPGVARERRAESVVDSILSTDVSPLAIGATEARALVRKLLWSAINDRRTVRVNLPPRYRIACENDILRVVDTDGTRFDLLIREIDVGDNMLVEIEATREIQEVLTQTGESEEVDSPITGNELPGNGDVLPLIGEPGSLNDDTFDSPTIIVSSGLEAIDGFWRTSIIYESYDNVNYHLKRQQETEGRVGFAVTELGDVTAVGCWDLVNTVDIQLLRGSLSSSTDADVLGGSNRILLAGEVIGFVSASLVGDRVYRLSRLIRGLRNSEEFTGTHAIGDECIILTSPGTEILPYNFSAIGQTRYFKFVSGGQSLSDVDAIEYTFTGRSLKPFSPVNPTSTRDSGTDDVTISWSRRTRLLVDCFAANLPLGEAYERYEVEIYDGATLLRTIVVSDATSVVYTAAEQTSDGISTGPFDVIIYQMSAKIGRGQPSESLSVAGA